VHGLNSLWFIPLTLAAAYYFLPKILGKSIYDYYVAIIGFWWLSVSMAFSSGSRLIGGPVPAWVGTLGTASNMLVLVGVLIVCVNLFGTLAGSFGAANKSVTLRFVVLGIFGFVFAAVLNFLLSLRGFAATAQFTFIPELRDWVVLYACFSTAMFGAAYFYLPRVTGKAWRSNALVTTHAYATLLGVLVLVVGLFFAGWQQGLMLNDAKVAFSDITKAMQPWFLFRTIVLMLLTLGHVAFAINFVWVACPFSSSSTPEAVISTPPALGLPDGHAAGGHHA
jgi:cytochrome c oxidase cbb3-type subunit 1